MCNYHVHGKEWKSALGVFDLAFSSLLICRLTLALAYHNQRLAAFACRDLV